jgi:hypothetical protein
LVFARFWTEPANLLGNGSKSDGKRFSSIFYRWTRGTEYDRGLFNIFSEELA